MKYSFITKSTLNKSGQTLSVSLLLAALLFANDAGSTVTVTLDESESRIIPSMVDPENFDKKQDCILAVQLKDPYVRAEYNSIIAESNASETRLSVEDMYNNIQTASYSPEPSFSAPHGNAILDPISMECLACHDGTIAKPVTFRISDGTLHREKSIETIKGAHPIGMDYEKFRMSAEYAPVEILPAQMVLINGKVGCITCHNMLGNNKKYLVVDIDSNNLCFTCHNK